MYIFLFSLFFFVLFSPALESVDKEIIQISISTKTNKKHITNYVNCVLCAAELWIRVLK